MLIQNAFDCTGGEDRSLGVLVATQDEFRRYPRLACLKGTILAWETAHQRFVSAVDNAGLDGLCILTPKPPAPGTFIQLLLDVPAGEVRANNRPLVGRAIDITGECLQSRPDCYKRRRSLVWSAEPLKHPSRCLSGHKYLLFPPARAP